MYLHCIRSLHFFQGSTNLFFHTQILSSSVTSTGMVSLLISIVYVRYTFSNSVLDSASLHWLHLLGWFSYFLTLYTVFTLNIRTD